jgi:hypothetical protein
LGELNTAFVSQGIVTASQGMHPTYCQSSDLVLQEKQMKNTIEVWILQQANNNQENVIFL